MTEMTVNGEPVPETTGTTIVLPGGLGVAFGKLMERMEKAPTDLQHRLDAEVARAVAAERERIRTLAQSWASLPGEDMPAEVDRRLGEWLLRVLDGECPLEGVRILAEGWMRPGNEGLFCPAAGQAVLDAMRGASTGEAAGWRLRAEAAEAQLMQLRDELGHAKSALAGDHEGIRLWMLDCGNLVDKHRKRAEHAEAASPGRMLREFHASQAVHAGLMPSTPTTDIPDWVRDLRMDLLDEEVGELHEAVAAGDIVKIADALADIEFITRGTAVTYGIPSDAVFAEVFRSNMTKVNTPEEAKLVKGPGYEPPRIAEILGAVRTGDPADVRDHRHRPPDSGRRGTRRHGPEDAGRAGMALVRAERERVMTSPAPSPMELWHQAGGGTDSYDRERYLELMRQHGHLLKPGDEGYEDASPNLSCGWPHRKPEAGQS